MINQIYPCLWFNGQAKHAAEFYCSVFENSEITNENLMVVSFKLNGMIFMGLNGGPEFTFNPSISLYTVCTTIEETNKIWDKLIVGGKALMPIGTYPWSERYGWLQDKFGLTWQISVANNLAASLTIKPCLLFTNKLFGKAKEAINFYSSVFDNSSTELLLHYPPEDINAGKVLFSEFKLNDYQLIAMDGSGVHEFNFNEAISFVVDCETQDEIDFYWAKLTENGQESMCGWLKDKFGVSWQVVPAVLNELMSDPEKSPQVIQAFMKMKKFDIETLLNA